jgi:hypothetical protein
MTTQYTGYEDSDFYSGIKFYKISAANEIKRADEHAFCNDIFHNKLLLIDGENFLLFE